MNLDDDKELWDLLGKADNRQASPMFTQNVLRAVRLETAAREEKRSLWSNLRDRLMGPAEPRWVSSAIAACVAVVCVGVMLLNPGLQSTSTLAEANIDQELLSLEQTALALGTENSDSSLIEFASCYSDSLSDDELQYVLAYL